jgi:predicted anti-sigma-YlaC factor YlaD
MPRISHNVAGPVLVLAAAALGACSVQRLAVNSISDVLAADGTVFESDPDPELVGEALPFALKLMESLLAQQPEHRGLLLAAARGFVLYGYAYVDLPAQQAGPEEGLEQIRALRRRARDLFLRGHGYALRALAIDYPGIGEQLRADPAEAAAAIGGSAESVERDVPAMYWTAVSLGLAISSARNEPQLLARLPEVEALLGRALILDEPWNRGSLHELALSLAAAGTSRTDPAVLERHYRRALELSAGRRASLFVTYAESSAVPRQDREAFVELLRQALAIDVDAYPSDRLVNVIAQQRAEWLMQHIDELFL